MGLPASKGIGTGEAQVFNQNKTYEAFQGMANRKMALDDYNKRLEEQKAKEAKEDAAKKKQQTNALWSTVKVDTRGMKPSDIELTQNEVNALRDKWVSRAEEISNFGAARNEFDKEFQAIQGNVSRRVDSYNQIKSVTERLDKEPDSYTQAQIDYAKELYDAPDVNMGENLGLFGKKLRIGDPNSDYVKLYEDSFYRDEYSNTSDDKKSWFKGDKFLPEKESLNNFKNNMTPEWMEKWNALYSGDESLDRDDSGELTEIGTEQMLKKAHDAVRANLRQSTDYGSVTVEDEEKPRTDFGYDNKNWNVSTVYDKDLGTNVLSVVKKSTGKPVIITGGEAIYEDEEGNSLDAKINGVANAIWVEDGYIKAKVSGKVGGKDVMSKVVTLRPTSFQQIKTAAGITDTYENFINKQKPTSEVGLKNEDNSNNESDPLGILNK